MQGRAISDRKTCVWQFSSIYSHLATLLRSQQVLDRVPKAERREPRFDMDFVTGVLSEARNRVVDRIEKTAGVDFEKCQRHYEVWVNMMPRGELIHKTLLSMRLTNQRSRFYGISALTHFSKFRASNCHSGSV